MVTVLPVDVSLVTALGTLLSSLVAMGLGRGLRDTIFPGMQFMLLLQVHIWLQLNLKKTEPCFQAVMVDQRMSSSITTWEGCICSP